MGQFPEIERIQQGWYFGIEGPDGSGKTTVSKRLREITGIPVFHRHPPIFGYDPKISMGMEWAALKLYKELGFSIIEERTFLGFDIYRNNQYYTPKIREEFIHLVTSGGKYLYVFLKVDNDVLRKRLAEQGEEVPNVDIDNAKYEDFFDRIRLSDVDYREMNMIQVDANGSVDDICFNILQGIKI